MKELMWLLLQNLNMVDPLVRAAKRGSLELESASKSPTLNY